MTRNTPGAKVPTMASTPQGQQASGEITIHTDLLFDPKQKKFLDDITITVSPKTGLITALDKRTAPLPAAISAPDIDLRGKTVLPGLVDAHTHIFLHPYSETPSINQERDESIIERTIRATNHCRTALLAGYTTYRDLGTEGAFDADTHVRNAVNRGLIPGPRLFCATEPLASSSGYEQRIESRINGVQVPRLSDPCDGPTGVKAGVRRRLGAGADVVKFYADYRKRALRYPEPSRPGCPDIMFPPSGDLLTGQRNPSLPLFDQEEMNSIVAEATAARAPVAAHAQSAEAVIMAAKAGVTSLEHGFERSSDAMRQLATSGTIFVPTLAVVELYIPMEYVFEQLREAYSLGVKLATGGDTGAFAHGDNAREMELMLEAGLPLEDVLTAATLHGWEACGGDWCGKRFGWWEQGVSADIVALEGDIRDSFRAKQGGLRDVQFVMKDAKVWKQDGVAIGML